MVPPDLTSPTTPTAMPADLAPAAGAAPLSEADRSLVLVMSRVLDPRHRDAYAELVRSAPSDPTDVEFDGLPADADADVRQDLGRGMVPYVRRIRAEHPQVFDPHTDAPRGPRSVARVAAAAVQELYNPAQVDVLRRIGDLLGAGARPAGSPGDGP